MAGGGAKVKDQASRERNRLHARNTRLRKKAHVEKLKKTMQVLSEESKQIEREYHMIVLREEQKHHQRRQVVKTMLAYRARGEKDRVLWESVLAPDFTLTVPVNGYESFDPAEAVDDVREVKGVDGTIRDAASFALMIQSIARRHRRGPKAVEVQFSLLDSDIVQQRECAMCYWKMTVSVSRRSEAAATETIMKREGDNPPPPPPQIVVNARETGGRQETT